MSTVEAATLTPDEIADVHEYKHTELVNGRLLEKTMSGQSVWVAGRVYKRLDDFAEKHHTGFALIDGQGYQCFGWDEGLVRRPDGSFITRGRLPEAQFVKGHIRVAPDIMVEVVSPNDSLYDIEKRVDDFLEAGTPLCWVFNPDRRMVTIFRKDGTVERIGEAAALTGEDVLPDFTCSVKDLFPPTDLAELL